MQLCILPVRYRCTQHGKLCQIPFHILQATVLQITHSLARRT